MRVRRGTAPQPAAAPPGPPVPDDGYRSLTVAEVLADLPSLDSAQLLLVKSLEEAGERRAVILDRVADLLVVQEAAQHLARVATPAPAPAMPQAPAAPAKIVSPELVDQMGDLLARSAARRGAAAAPTAPPLPPPAAPPATPAAAPGGATQPAPNGVIVPGNRRRIRGRRGAKAIILVVVVALLGAGAALFWKQTHSTTSTATPPAQPARDPLGERLVKTLPAGFVHPLNSVSGTGPSDLARAATDDGFPDAQAFLTQAGFLHGYRGLWSSAGQQQDLVVLLYHFRTSTGAAAFASRTVTENKTRTRPAPVGAPVTGIPGAIGLVGSPGGAHTATVVFTSGVYSVQVIAQGPATTGLLAVVQQVAAAQYALLPPA